MIHIRAAKTLQPLSKIDKLAFPILSVSISLMIYDGVFLLMVTFNRCKKSLAGWVLALFSVSMLVLLFLSILLSCGIVIEYKDPIFTHLKIKKLRNYYSNKLKSTETLSNEELKTFRNNPLLHLKHMTQEYWKPFLKSFVFKMDQKSLDSIQGFDQCHVCEKKFRIDCIFATTTCCSKLYHLKCLEKFCFSTMRCPGCSGNMIYCIIDGMTGEYSDRDLGRILAKQVRRKKAFVLP